MAISHARMTEEAFMRLPDDGHKYELVDGEAKMSPAGFEHDVIGMRISFLLMPYARGRGFLAGSQAGFRMTGGNIRSPDLSFTRKERLTGGKPTKGFGDFAPDLCIEIVSPSEDTTEMQQKRNEYFASGAQQVWYVFPESQSITVYTAPTEFRRFTASDTLEGGALLPGFRCLVAELCALE